MFVGEYRIKPMQPESTEYRSNDEIAGSAPSRQLEANAFITIQYASIGTQEMEEHNGTHNARKHE